MNPTFFMQPFKDDLHLERLRKDLWASTGYGQAAVMVGSGFSLNAEPIHGGQQRFPMWRDLAETMFHLLNPKATTAANGNEQMLRSTSGLGGIGLASEYEVTFGRSALDQMLLTSIPNDQYKPGALHLNLMELPWSDVFTTNYDTLLERTSVEDRYYQVIQNHEDLPGSTRPRIFKLHGSFPSQRPFIITSEDYRTYPRVFAPFVNTVQQSLMENSLVLLGFSGDDPNFLYWSGWVRDQLGDRAPKMYLCGALDISDSQKSLLAQRGVITVDLSPVIADLPVPPGKTRHSLALEWLILSLKNGKPSNSLYWPSRQEQCVQAPSYLPPPLPPADEDIPDAPLFLEPGKSFNIILPTVLTSWKAQRKAYPGWVITPHENRKQLWAYTENWLFLIGKATTELSPTLRLSFLFELNWRLEHCLIPLFPDFVKAVDNALDFPLAEYDRTVESPEYCEEAWENLAFALVREARERFSGQRHEKWMNLLQSRTNGRSDLHARWHHESCLSALWRLDQHSVRKGLNEWTCSPELLIWQIRRASICAEIGELSQAEAITTETLVRIRSGLRARQNQIELLSLEGWSTRLLGSIRRGYKFSSEGDDWSRFRDRWLQLTALRCDPWQDTAALNLQLESPKPPVAPNEAAQGFGASVPGTEPITAANLSPTMPAFSLMRLYEEAGLPMRAGIMTFADDYLKNACRWIMPYSPLWSITTLIRAGEKMPLLERFDRSRIATMSTADVEAMSDWLIPALQVTVDCLPQQSTANRQTFSERILGTLVGLISKISSRLSQSQLEILFHLSLRLHRHPSIRSDLGSHDICWPIFKHVFLAATDPQIGSWLLDLLLVPTSFDRDPGQATLGEQQWPDPLEAISADRLGSLNDHFKKNEQLATRIEQLIQEVSLGEGQARRRSSYRLWLLAVGGVLNDSQLKSFGMGLWKKVDPKSGLPSGTVFRSSAFLNLPSPDRVAAKQLVRMHLLSQKTKHWYLEYKSENGKKSGELRDCGQENPMIRDVLLVPGRRSVQPVKIDWTAEEASVLLSNALEWWDSDKAGLLLRGYSNDLFGLRDNLLMAFSDLIPLFAKVIMPRLPKTCTADWAQLERVIKELEENGIHTTSCLPSSLLAWPERAAAIAGQIGAAFLIGGREEIASAVQALGRWLTLSNAVPRPPVNLLDDLCHLVAVRHEPGLDEILKEVCRMLQYTPKAFAERHFAHLCNGLKCLLKETSLSQIEEGSTTFVRIPLERRPRYRTLSARLACRIHATLDKRRTPIPSIILEWKSASASELLPEIRNEWSIVY